MARPHEDQTPLFPKTPHDAAEDDVAAASPYGCFRRLCFGWPTADGGESRRLLSGGGAPARKEAWIVSKLKKLKEISEMVAGPKWKNLIRKLSKICNPKRCKNNKAAAQFKYSPESYALNFAGDDREDDGDLLHSFSTRFAPGFFINDQQRRTVF